MDVNRPTLVCSSVTSVVMRCATKTRYINTLNKINANEDLLRKHGLSSRNPAT